MEKPTNYTRDRMNMFVYVGTVSDMKATRQRPFDCVWPHTDRGLKTVPDRR